MQEMLKLRISKKRMNKGVATQKVITFSKRVVDLQPTHNRFLHFSSLCLSLRLFWGISVCLLAWFGLRSVHGLERTFNAYSKVVYTFQFQHRWEWRGIQAFNPTGLFVF